MLYGIKIRYKGKTYWKDYTDTFGKPHLYGNSRIAWYHAPTIGEKGVIGVQVYEYGEVYHYGGEYPEHQYGYGEDK